MVKIPEMLDIRRHFLDTPGLAAQAQYDNENDQCTNRLTAKGAFLAYRSFNSAQSTAAWLCWIAQGCGLAISIKTTVVPRLTKPATVIACLRPDRVRGTGRRLAVVEDLPNTALGYT